MKVLIKQVLRQSSQGRHKQEIKIQRGKFVTMRFAENLKASNENGKSCKDTFKPKMNASIRKYSIGLEEVTQNPFYKGTPSDIQNQYNLPISWADKLSDLVRRESIALQTLLEIRAGVDPGTFTSNIPFKNNLPDIRNKTFLMDFTVSLEGNRDHVLDLENPIDHLKYLCLVSRPDVVAPNLDLANPASHNWYIAGEFEEEQKTAYKNKLQNDAIVVLVDLERNYSIKEQYMVGAQLPSNSSYLIQGNINNNTLSQLLNDYIKSNEKDAQARQQIFMELVTLLKANYNKFYVDYLITQAIVYNVVEIQNGFLFWASQKNSPNLFRFDSVESFAAKIYTEYEVYSPAEGSGKVYEILVNELQHRGAQYVESDMIKIANSFNKKKGK